jgi:hypothetical protein
LQPFANSCCAAAWVVIGEIFAVITPYRVGTESRDANLGSRVFFVWGSLCALCFIYAYVLIPETKGLSLEQVDRMMEETTPRTSAKWVPHSTFAADMGMTDKGTLAPEVIEKVAGPNTTNTESNAV